MRKTTPKGLEPLSSGAQPSLNTEVTADEQSVWAPRWARLAQDDPELTAVLTAWPELPEAVKAGIVAMVKAARGA